MTREEAKELWCEADGSELDDVLVDKIFDSLDCETCSNCAYASDANDDEGELIYCDEIGIEMSKTFGCIYFNTRSIK